MIIEYEEENFIKKNIGKTFPLDSCEYLILHAITDLDFFFTFSVVYLLQYFRERKLTIDAFILLLDT